MWIQSYFRRLWRREWNGICFWYCLQGVGLVPLVAGTERALYIQSTTDLPPDWLTWHRWDPCGWWVSGTSLSLSGSEPSACDLALYSRRQSGTTAGTWVPALHSRDILPSAEWSSWTECWGTPPRPGGRSRTPSCRTGTVCHRGCTRSHGRSPRVSRTLSARSSAPPSVTRKIHILNCYVQLE